MFQTFDATAQPDQGPPRLALLRQELSAAGMDGFLVPRADAHQGEYVAARDDRLAWLTGFTGSAGFAAILADVAGVFIDGRYRVQVTQQVADAFTPVPWPEVSLGDWLKTQLPSGGTVGFDPWLHTLQEIEKLTTVLDGSGITLVETNNLIDRIWPDQPGAPLGPITPYPAELAGVGHADKLNQLAQLLRAGGQRAAVLTLPDSIAWVLNIRGSDIHRIPVPHAFAVLHDDARLTLYAHEEKYSADLRAHLGAAVTLRPIEGFAAALRSLVGPVRVDMTSAPLWGVQQLVGAGVEITWEDDPCILPKACKNAAEIAGARAAHLRDATAVCEFLAWLDVTAGQAEITEIDVVTELEAMRRATGQLRDISFDTIAGAGPNGAIVHYRVTRETNRAVNTDELLLIDSGGQYLDGTTDITRTLAIGDVGDTEKQAFTRVLQGMIAISRARFPEGLAGRDLDALARYALWQAGMDYDHGTGHGVGSYLSVHEGPQRLSRLSHVPLKPGMILSNEPGYYRAGAFGIRIENLIVVRKAAAIMGGDDRAMLDFETLTFVPIDRRVIVTEMLTTEERAWLNTYHADVAAKIGPHLSAGARDWLTRVCAPL